MINEHDKQLMFKFLEKNYPVSRLKHNGRFKRAMLIDGETEYFLSEESHHIQIRGKLHNILLKVFSCDNDTAKYVMSSFLNLK